MSSADRRPGRFSSLIAPIHTAGVCVGILFCHVLGPPAVADMPLNLVEAHNERAGDWQAAVTDLYTNATATAGFTIEH